MSVKDYMEFYNKDIKDYELRTVAEDAAYLDSAVDLLRKSAPEGTETILEAKISGNGQFGVIGIALIPLERLLAQKEGLNEEYRKG